MNKPYIQVIIGSVREGRSGAAVGHWFMEQVAHRTDVELELVDLKDWDLPLDMEAKIPAMNEYSKETTKKWSAQVSKADGYIFVTPEYNHGYPAGLKNALDQVYHEWAKKPAAFIGYGALGASRAIEQLVPVVAQIGMVPLSSRSINIIDAWAAFDDKGGINQENIRGDANKLLNTVIEWANDLKQAREKAALVAA